MEKTVIATIICTIVVWLLPGTSLRGADEIALLLQGTFGESAFQPFDPLSGESFVMRIPVNQAKYQMQEEINAGTAVTTTWRGADGEVLLLAGLNPDPIAEYVCGFIEILITMDTANPDEIRGECSFSTVSEGFPEANPSFILQGELGNLDALSIETVLRALDKRDVSTLSNPRIALFSPASQENIPGAIEEMSLSSSDFSYPEDVLEVLQGVEEQLGELEDQNLAAELADLVEIARSTAGKYPPAVVLKAIQMIDCLIQTAFETGSESDLTLLEEIQSELVSLIGALSLEAGVNQVSQPRASGVDPPPAGCSVEITASYGPVVVDRFKRPISTAIFKAAADPPGGTFSWFLTRSSDSEVYLSSEGDTAFLERRGSSPERVSVSYMLEDGTKCYSEIEF